MLVVYKFEKDSTQRDKNSLLCAISHLFGGEWFLDRINNKLVGQISDKANLEDIFNAVGLIVVEQTTINSIIDIFEIENNLVAWTYSINDEVISNRKYENQQVFLRFLNGNYCEVSFPFTLTSNEVSKDFSNYVYP